MLDFLMELAAEIAGEGLEALIHSKRVPQWIRVALVTLLGGGLVGLFILLAVQLSEWFLRILFGTFAVGMLVLVGYLIRKIQNDEIDE